MAKPKHQVLIVDDEEDIHAVTQLGLRSLKYNGKRCEFLSAHSGAEAVQMVRDNPNISVILLDVVMESDHAGLEACRSIRTELGNTLVRIILRTGQPGSSPEKETIDDYDIDGYLAKTEITATKLYSTVRTALKAWHELMELDRHKRSLALINDCAMAVHSYEPLEDSLTKILSAAAAICNADSAVLSLQTFEQSEVASNYLMHQTSIEDNAELKAYVNRISSEVSHRISAQSDTPSFEIEAGTVFTFALHQELGHGWIYLERTELDELQLQAMSLLSGHAANALYSAVAQKLLTAGSDEDEFDLMAI